MLALLRYRGKVFDPNVLEVMGRILGNSKAESAFGTRQRVLLVEPDPEEATILELHLSDAGLDVHIARTLVQAREALRGAEFELVVAEVILPDGDGIELLAEARTLNGGESLGWVVYTSSNSQSKAQRAFALGALDFVAKPIAVGVFVAKLRAMIDQRTRKRQGGVSGSLAEMGLPEIVQAVLQGRKSGRLTIERGADRGEVLFLEGSIADATCGTLHGEEAFYALLKLKTGEFSLDPTSVPTTRIIAESPEMLLLEGMRRIDENL
jgi:DNA-binding response OmpR family regulator